MKPLLEYVIIGELSALPNNKGAFTNDVIILEPYNADNTLISQLIKCWFEYKYPAVKQFVLSIYVPVFSI